MSYELYWVSGSPHSWRVMLAMELKGIDYVSHRLDPAKGEHKSPEFMAMNPRGKVPVLKDGDTVIYESTAILVYLESRHPMPALFGSSAKETAHIWQRISELENYAREPLYGVTRPIYRGQVNEQSDAIKQCATDSHGEFLQVENMLSGSDYLAGDALSAADIVYMPVVQGFLRAVKRDDAAPLDLGFQNFEALYPKVSAWLGQIESLPSYDKAYPPHWRE